MAANFTVKIDKADVERRLGNLKSKAPTVIARALNDTAKRARQRLAQKAQQTYTVKIGGFTSTMKIKRATAGNLDASIDSSGEPLSITRFSYKTSRSIGASAEIIKGHGFKTLEEGGIKAFKSASLHGNIFRRYGSPRLPIKKQFGPSVPKMIESDKYVYGVLKPVIQSDLNASLSKEIAKLVG